MLQKSSFRGCARISFLARANFLRQPLVISKTFVSDRFPTLFFICFKNGLVKMGVPLPLSCSCRHFCVGMGGNLSVVERCVHFTLEEEIPSTKIVKKRDPSFAGIADLFGSDGENEFDHEYISFAENQNIVEVKKTKRCHMLYS